IFVPLVRALKNCDAGSRQVLVRCIPSVNLPAAHGELVALLDSKDPAVRGAAMQILCKVGGKTALAGLTTKLAQKSFVGRIEAIDIVCKCARHRAIPALVGAVPVASLEEKLRIIRYLGDAAYMEADRVAALSALKSFLGDPDDALVVAAVRAFGELGTEEEWFDHIDPILEHVAPSVVVAAIESLRSYRSVRVLTVLRGRLGAGPKSLRLAVLNTLLAIGTADVLPLVVEGLSHKDMSVRNRAAEVLADLGAHEDIDIARTVLWLLRSPEPKVRRLAVGVARQARDPSASLWPRLLELLRDEDWWVRERVADALLAIAGDQMLGHLAQLLTDDAATIRMFAVDVLGRLGNTRALGALVRVMMDDKDWWVRERAMEAVASLGDKRVSPFLAHILHDEPGMRIAALDALARLRATDEWRAIASLLQDSQEDVRLAALRCIEALDDPRVAHSLGAVAEDPNDDIRALARQLQARWRARLNLSPGDWNPVLGSPLDRLLARLTELGADDLMLSPGDPPMAKRLGSVVAVDDAALTPEALSAMILPILSAEQLEALQARRDVDLSYEVRSTGSRFRANVFQQIRGTGVVFRVVRNRVPSMDELGLPPQVQALTKLSNGLVLIGGATGSGKSTTIASMIDDINRTSRKHIVTLEDPIEVVHPVQQAVVNQREVGRDTGTYADALRATLRQDPDVLLVGELRDIETIRFAVTAAETGHLVFGTVHTVAADTTVDRLINAFPAAEQAQVRTMLAGSLRAIVCQNLLRRCDEDARVLACEIMFNNSGVSQLIRIGKAHQLLSTIAVSRQYGMQTMDSELLRLVEEELISGETAYLRARNKQEFAHLVSGGAADADDAADPQPGR
ncbi:MAG: PilT/PilU family type 4a pilus ATPase, partial [Oligoflexia bacterium]|nr:PilT/PilU family type 4a pilus ATPase [Oligoflexia bacterium]